MKALKRKRSLEGLVPFLDQVSIELADKKVKLFKDAKESWQQDLLDPLIPAIEQACGLRDDYVGPHKFFITLPKSHAKTTKIGLLVTWALCFSPQQVRVMAAAGDQKQAGFLLEAIQMIHRENDWLHPLFKIIQYRANGNGGYLTIESSEAMTKSGALADIIIVDELTFWDGPRKKALWDFLDDTTTKRPNTVLIVISNAGIIDSWQHKLISHAKISPSIWYVKDEPGRKASWINVAQIEEARSQRTPGHAKRVYDNIWVNSDEEGEYLPRPQVEACVDNSLAEQTQGIRGIDYFLAMDYGAVKDRATAAIMHQDPDTKYVILDKLYIHQGSKKDRTPIDLMIEWGEEATNQFYIKELWLDPNQLEAVAQRFERVCNVKRYAFQGEGHYKMAENLRNLVTNKKIRFYPKAGELILPDSTEEDLVDELASLIVEPVGNAGRYRFNHRSGKHDDRATVVALGSLAAVSQKQRFNVHAVLDAMLGVKPDSTGPLTVENSKPAQPNRRSIFLDSPKETKMVHALHAQIKYVNVYNTWQACPMIDGVEIRLKDYHRQEEAAYAVNVAHELIGVAPPNFIHPDKMPQGDKAKQIAADVKKELEKRSIIQPKKLEVSPKK